MARTAIQLYSLRKMDEPLTALLDRVGETDFDGVELAGLDDEPPDEVRDALADADLAVAAAHVPFDELDGDLDGTVRAYDEVDCDRLVVPYLDESHFESRAAAAETAAALAELRDGLSDRGTDLCYHNHDHEFVDLDGDEDAFDVFVDETEMDIELDVGWALAAGRDPTALLDRLSGRVPLVHLKDVDAETRTPVELGEGDLDVEACARAAREAGAEWLVYEHDDPDDPARSLAHGADALAGLRGDSP